MRKCHTLNSLRQTLQDLPIGLYETYDRILLNVPEVHRVHVQRALIWLAFSREPMTLGQVAEAVLVGREQQSMDRGDHFRDVHDLLDLCSSFVCLVGKPPLWSPIQNFRQEFGIQQITADAYLVLRLAHSSVKEYMLSDRTVIASLSMNRLTPGVAQRFMAEVSLIYLNRFDDKSLIWNENIQTSLFLFYAAHQWYFHYDDMPTEEEDKVVDLLLSFINTYHDGYAFGNWLHFLDHLSVPETPRPLAALSSLGCYKAVKAIGEKAAEVHITEDVIRESLNCASRKGHKAVVRVLLDGGARFNRAGVIDASSLSHALSRAIAGCHTEVIELLISKGATGESLDYSFVSGIAAMQGQLHLVKLLLD